MKYPVLCALLVVTCAASATRDLCQEVPTGDQNGTQQQKPYQKMTPEERAASTRAFLGLGAVPDKAAAALGAPLFRANCAVCHGQQARGAMGPTLITSDEVVGDDHGEQLVSYLKAGRPGKGMPSFATMPDEQLKEIAEFLHLQVEDVANRGAYHVLNILVGNPAKGQAYVEGHCMSCHTAQTTEHTDTYSHLNSSQRRAIKEVLVSRDRVHGLQGYAGVGKTAALTAIREGAESHGYTVDGLAPTSRAAHQLRLAGIPADTLQGFLARGGQQIASDPGSRHLYMIDESSLTSTRQMKEFLTRIAPQDRVLLIGDTRQHQGVEAGKPFEQLVQAGMRTAKLDEIVRQKDPELKVAVELARGEVAIGIDMLQQQGRVKEIPDPVARIDAIARDFATNPDRTLIISPDNASRRQINDAVRHALQVRGMVNPHDHTLRVLVPRQELTGAERQWAFRYQVGDVLHYVRGSKGASIEGGSYARVVAINPVENLLTVKKTMASSRPTIPNGCAVSTSTGRWSATLLSAIAFSSLPRTRGCRSPTGILPLLKESPVTGRSLRASPMAGLLFFQVLRIRASITVTR